MRYIAFVLSLLFSQPLDAGGLGGDIIRGVGKAVGSKQIEQLGKDADRLHREFKDTVRPYKDFEEGASKFVREAVRDACAVPFQSLTNAVIAECSNWNGRTSERDIIDRAVSDLIRASVFKRSEFKNVQIRWCPLRGAHGMAPDRNRIYLDTSMKDASRHDIAALLAHEMIHIRQYRQLGSDRFKCRYSKEYLNCGGCQDSRNAFEREAYDFESYVQRVLRSGRSISVHNKCHESIWMALRHRNSRGEWRTDGWWKFDEGEQSFPVDDRTRRLKTNTNEVYLFAEIIDRDYSWSGEYERSLGDQRLSMRKASPDLNEDGDWLISLTCDNISKRTPLYVKNNCRKDIDLAVRYRLDDEEWETQGWYSLSAGRKTFLNREGRETRIKSNNSIFYFYAKSEDGTSEWRGKEPRPFDGAKLPMRKIKLEKGDGNYVLSLTCSN